MIHEAVLGVPVEDILAYLTVVLGGMAAALWAIVIVDALRPRKRRELKPEPEPGEPRPRGPKATREERQAELLKELGVDQAMARLFYRKLREALEAGEVKPALVSEKCDGYVTFDFVRQGWICVERDGSARPLSGSHAGERLEVEDWERG